MKKFILLAMGFAALLPVAIRADQNLAGNVTVTGGSSTGNLNVTGSVDVDGPIIGFGTIGTSTVGNSLIFSDSTATSGTTGDTLTFSANRATASWLWLHNASTSAMRLNSLHQLLLYQADGSTAGITLTPASNQLSLGAATLTGSGTTLTAGAAMTVNGAFTATGGITNTTGAFSGPSALSFTAGGTNQNVTFTPSGSGNTVLNGNVGIGTSTPQFRLDVLNNNYNAIRATGNSSNSVGIYIQNTIASGRQWALLSSGGGASGIPVGSFSLWDDSGGGPRLTVNALGNVGIGTTTPGSKLHVFGTSDQIQLAVRAFSTQSGGQVLSVQNSQGNVAWFNDAGNLVLNNAANGGSTLNAASLITTNSAQDLQIQPGGVGAIYIKAATGNVGIGTTTPMSYAVLDVNTTGQKAIHTMDAANGGILIGYNGSTIQARTTADANTGNLILQGWGGNVGIGTTTPTQKLSVNGTIRAKEIIVDTGWADYVFDPSYRLAPLSEVEKYIKADKHLPGIPSAQEIADHGVSMGDIQSKLLSKIEELTLHMIDQEKRIERLERENSRLRGQSINP